MILSCQNISKSFGTDEILKNVSFHIEENEKAAVVGINGAGKSTLIKLLLKELEPTSGTIVINDKILSQIPRRQIPRFRRNDDAGSVTGSCH